MLADPRADALLDEFAAKWPDYKQVESHDVDTKLFPRFTPALARRCGSRPVASCRSSCARMAVPEMLSARFTFVDSALATHYGLTRSGGPATDFVRVDTSSAPRAGLLTLGAFLTTTAQTGLRRSNGETSSSPACSAA